MKGLFLRTTKAPWTEWHLFPLRNNLWLRTNPETFSFNKTNESWLISFCLHPVVGTRHRFTDELRIKTVTFTSGGFTLTHSLHRFPPHLLRHAWSWATQQHTGFYEQRWNDQKQLVTKHEAGLRPFPASTAAFRHFQLSPTTRIRIRIIIFPGENRHCRNLTCICQHS